MHEERCELQAVLASTAFVRSARMAALLNYLCGKYFAGDADHLKEYSIAVEVLGRPDTFDPAQDAIARVEVHRLRRKLREYYEGEGSNHPIHIQIPSGSYVPSFTPYAAKSEVAILSGPVPPTALVATKEFVRPPPPRTQRKWVVPTIAAFLAGTLIAAAIYFRPSAARSSSDQAKTQLALASTPAV